MTPLRWTSKSLRRLAEESGSQGHRVSASLVGRLLHQAGSSLIASNNALAGSNFGADLTGAFRCGGTASPNA